MCSERLRSAMLAAQCELPVIKLSMQVEQCLKQALHVVVCSCNSILYKQIINIIPFRVVGFMCMPICEAVMGRESIMMVVQ